MFLTSPKGRRETEKENADYLTSSTLPRYRQTPCRYIRVKAHAEA